MPLEFLIEVTWVEDHITSGDSHLGNCWHWDCLCLRKEEGPQETGSPCVLDPLSKISKEMPRWMMDNGWAAAREEHRPGARGRKSRAPAGA